MQNILNKYAHLLVNYCLELKKGETVYVKSTWLAEPLLQEFLKECLIAGAHPLFSLGFQDENKIFNDYASKHQLEFTHPSYKQIMKEYNAYLFIRAPFNLKEMQNADSEKSRIASMARSEVMKVYNERTSTRNMKRNLCQYPTQAAAQEAGMSLGELQEFIFNSCFLYDENPGEKWLEVRKNQQHIVDHLNKCTKIRYRSSDFDVSFSTKGRTWINSDGQTNMPSGEVYTSPVEDSVNGTVRFSYPGIYMGNAIEDITLSIKDGTVQSWDARVGKPFLDKIMEIPGARNFGEAAIGTNYNIQTFTKNMLYDEKMGGTIHMALGQSYLQTGGKNQSAIHWDLLADMKDGGEIFADEELIYKGGKFLI